MNVLSRALPFLAVALLAPATARAQATEAVALVDSGCDAELFRASTLRGLLALELADVGASLVQQAPPDVWVSLESEACEASQGTVSIDVGRGDAPRVLELFLDGADERSRARIVAVAIAELVLATRDLDPASAGSPDERGASADHARDELARHRRRAYDEPLPPEPPPPLTTARETWLVQLTTAAGGLYFPTVSTGFATMRLGMRLAAPPRWPWVLELSARGATGRGAPDRPIGIHHVTGQLALLVIARTTPLEIGGGAEVEAGLNSLESRDGTARSDTLLDPIVTLSARATLHGRIDARTALTVDVRAGWALLGVELRRGEHAWIGASGPMLGVEVGVAFDL